MLRAQGFWNTAYKETADPLKVRAEPGTVWRGFGHGVDQGWARPLVRNFIAFAGSGLRMARGTSADSTCR
jgi:hypothetical protein